MRFAVGFAATYFLAVWATCAWAQQPTAEPTANSADEKSLGEIQAGIDSYVAAFNKGDAKGLAAHWTEAGELTTPEGESLGGRQQLEQAFAKYFEENKSAKIELVETYVDLLSPSVGVETGISRVLLPEQEPSESMYEAIHVKTSAGWKLDRVSETPPPALSPSNYEQLSSLEWMVGTWQSADNASVETSCRWTTNRNFLVRTFRVYIADRVDFEGTQVIGWDPHAGTIRSWLFDSDGGFGVGRWSHDAGRWTVATLNVLPDGRRGSSTNVYEMVDENTVRFSSVGRQVDGELLPSIAPITIVRAPAE